MNDAPLLVAANREEFYDRPALPPRVQAGSPSILCGVDQRAGGTWLGVNEHGLVAAVTNRPRPDPPRSPRSRGLLCREMLNFDRAEAAVEFASQQLAAGDYLGANFVALDCQFAAVVHAGDRVETVELTPGLHVLTRGDVDDPSDPRQALARTLFARHAWQTPQAYLAAAKEVCAAGPDKRGDAMVLHGTDRGTASSTIFALAAPPERSLACTSAGPPDLAPYEDLSDVLRTLLRPTAARW